jgi:hypothetical protein
MIKFVVIALLAVILVSLGSGLVFLITDRGRTKRTVKALTLRIGLSLVAFLILMVGFATGVIKPHGLLPPQPTQSDSPHSQ